MGEGPYARSSAVGSSWPQGKPYPEPEWSMRELLDWWDHRFGKFGLLYRPVDAPVRMPWFVRLARRFS